MADNEQEDLETTATPSDAANSDDKTDANAPFASWLFLLAGLVAGVLVIPTISVVKSEFNVQMPAEYDELTRDSDNAESASKASAMLAENQTENHSRFLIAVGSVMALVFGWAAGFIHGRILFGIIGAVVGVVLAVVLGTFLPRTILDLQNTAIQDHEHGDFYSMAVYASQWMVFGVPVVAAVGIAVGRLSSFVKTLGIGLMAAILGGVVYVIGGTLLSPELSMAWAVPSAAKTGMYLWALAAPLLIGLFMSRTRL